MSREGRRRGGRCRARRRCRTPSRGVCSRTCGVDGATCYSCYETSCWRCQWHCPHRHRCQPGGCHRRQRRRRPRLAALLLPRRRHRAPLVVACAVHGRPHDGAFVWTMTMTTTTTKKKKRAMEQRPWPPLRCPSCPWKSESERARASNEANDADAVREPLDTLQSNPIQSNYQSHS